MNSMRPFSEDLRRRIIAIPKSVGSTEVGARFGVSASFVRKFRQRVREGGDISATPYSGRVRKVNADNEAHLTKLVAKHPDAILYELCQLFEASTSVSLSLATMSRQLRRMGITLKKNAGSR
jgi:transposase